MVPRRCIALSPDNAFADRLVSALRGTSDVVEAFVTTAALEDGEIEAALCVLHVAGAFAPAATAIIQRLSVGCRVIAVLPRASLDLIVELMQASERVAGMMVAEDLDLHRLNATAVQLLTGDVFGVDKAVAPQTELYTTQVSDRASKTACMAYLGAAIEQARIPRSHHAAIEQCVDEMLANALYDAPLDEDGRPLYANLPPRVRSSLVLEHAVTVQYGCDGKRFAVAVRDGYGALERSTFLRFLDKCMHAAQPIDRKAGGAGVGLYLMVSSASAVLFHVVPGVATEVVCAFDVGASGLQLAQLGFVTELHDATGALVPARRQPVGTSPRFERPPRRGRRVALAAATVAVGLALGTWRALHAPHHKEPSTPAPPLPVATLVLDSQPSGAEVTIDGVAVGDTPLTWTTRESGKDIAVVLRSPGYHDAALHAKLPGLGETRRMLQPLERSAELVRVHFVSRPLGARVVSLGAAWPGELGNTYTPADVFVHAGEVQRFELTMPHHAPFVVAPFTPARGTDAIEQGGTLADASAPP